jgi:ubiquinone/menaquinone biosynthesis C-methylase UbiE
MIGKDYYDYGLSKGVDLNFFGDWQKAYAKMIVHCSNVVPVAANAQKKGSVFLDFGTGCGLIVRAIKELNIFTHCHGVDINQYLIDIGRKAQGLSEEELFFHDILIEPLPFENDSITFLHSSQVLEHIEEDQIDNILSEFNRVMSKDGVAFITVAALTEQQDEEPTHITLKEKSWWDNQIKKYFKQNNITKMRFKTCTFSPDNSDKNFHHYYSNHWYVYGLRKE